MSNDIKIVKGKTFRDVIRWESAPVIYKAITWLTLSPPHRFAGWRT